MSINLILGTMTFGEKTDEENSHKIITYFLNSHYTELDTAYVYNNGISEQFIGSYISAEKRQQVKIDSKINPRVTGTLNKESINMQVTTSLNRLKTDYIDVLYIHFPDDTVSLESILFECNNLYSEGKIKELGLSNFPSWMVIKAWYISKINGWILPTVYEGLYNAFSRNVEKELFVAIRDLGIKFYAYNPLAGGILSGKYLDYTESPDNGRFKNRPNYKNRYWNLKNFDALKILKLECDRLNISIAQASYRWLAFHSKLSFQNGDAIIVGASSVDQLKENIDAVERGPLPNSIVQIYNSVWSIVESDSPDYFRYTNKVEV